MTKHQGSFFAQEAIGGLSAGVVGTIIGFPLDTIKTRMSQTHSSASRNIFSMTRYIVAKEGVFALYRGLVPPLLSLSALNTINFTSYSYFRNDILEASRGWDIKNGLAGMACGPLASSISTIENLVKTQMQMDNIREKKYTGSFHCLTTLTRNHGLKVVYTGHVINTLREATFLMTYFFVYEGFRGMLFETEWINPRDKSDHHTEIHKWAIPVAGGLAGAIGWTVSFPLECVRMGVQGQTVDRTSKWKGSVQVFKELMENRGIRALYRGVTPTILRAFLVSGSRFSAYETALWLLRNGGWDKQKQ